MNVRDAGTGRWGKLHNGGLRSLYSEPYVRRVVTVGGIDRRIILK